MQLSSSIATIDTNFINALPEMEMTDKTLKVRVMTAIGRYPTILQNAAFTVTAMPPTQMTVKRLFSALRIIQSDLRTLIKEDLLETIRFLRTIDFPNCSSLWESASVYTAYRRSHFSISQPKALRSRARGTSLSDLKSLTRPFPLLSLPLNFLRLPPTFPLPLPLA